MEARRAAERRMRALLQHATYDPALQAVPAARGGEGSECREIGSDEIGQLCEAYVRDGFVHVRALVCPPAATAAVRALWSQMEGAVDGLQRGAPESWTTVGQWSGRVDDVAVLNCWSKGHLAVAAALRRSRWSSMTSSVRTAVQLISAPSHASHSIRNGAVWINTAKVSTTSRPRQGAPLQTNEFRLCVSWCYARSRSILWINPKTPTTMCCGLAKGFSDQWYY